MITAIEGLSGRNRSLSGLGISVVFGKGENVHSEFSQIKNKLLEWHRLRKGACGALMIEYQVEESQWELIKNFWWTTVERDNVIQRVFTNIGEVKIQMVTTDGRKITSVGFELGGPAL
jgi:hypothetical protein